MPEITRRRRGELVRGVIDILKKHPDGYLIKDLLIEIETLVPPTDFENSHYPKRPEIRRYERIIRFGTISSVKAGWIVKNRGLWSVTQAGLEAYDNYKDPDEFMQEADRLYRKWADEQPEAEEETDGSPGTTATLEEAEEEAWTELEDHLSSMNPYDFQNLVAGLLQGMGYFVSWVAPPGPDKGIDIIASTDPLGVSGPRIKAQVKRRADKVDVKELRSFLATLTEDDVGFFVSMGGFTRDAEEEARYQEKRRITLVDSRKLIDLWIQHYNKIPELNRRLLPLRPIYFLDLSE